MKKFIIGIIVGIIIATTTSAYADSVKQFILTKVSYPLIVKGKVYDSASLPLLNFNGNTYVPLKAVGDLLGVTVNWNEKLNRVEIGHPVTVNETTKSNTVSNTYSASNNSSNNKTSIEQKATQGKLLLEKKIQNFLDGYKAKGITLIDYNKFQRFLSAKVNSGTLPTSEISDYLLNRGSKYSSDGKTVISYLTYKGKEYPYKMNVQVIHGDFGYLSSDYVDLSFLKTFIAQKIFDEYNKAIKTKTWGM